MRAYVKALNQYRRANTKPLTTAEKRARIEEALKADPERSDVVIAKEVGANPSDRGSHTTRARSRRGCKIYTPLRPQVQERQEG